MARKQAHPDAPAPDAATRRRRRAAEPREDEDAVARAARDAAGEDAAGRHQLGMQNTREVDIRDVNRDEDDDTFSEGAIGGLDPDDVPGQDNPQGMQTGRGPLNQDDQGNRQNAEAEELENVEPDIDPFRSPR